MLQVLDSAETWFARVFGPRRGHHDSDLCANPRAASHLDDYERLKRAFAALRREHGMKAQLLRSELEVKAIIWPEDKDMACARVDIYREECRRVTEGQPTPLHSSSRLELGIGYHAYQREGETKAQNEKRTTEVASLICRVLRENGLHVAWDGGAYDALIIKPESPPAISGVW